MVEPGVMPGPTIRIGTLISLSSMDEHVSILSEMILEITLRFQLIGQNRPIFRPTLGRFLTEQPRKHIVRCVVVWIACVCALTNVPFPCSQAQLAQMKAAAIYCTILILGLLTKSQIVDNIDHQTEGVSVKLLHAVVASSS